MSYAQIDIGFTKYSDPAGTEYMLHTTINAATTQPTVVDTSLRVKKGSDIDDEELVTVATRAQLITSPLPVLPADVDVFSSPSLALAQIGDPLAPTTIQDGDVIRITTPDRWQQFFSADPEEEYVVDTVVNPTTVTVTTPFPAFARGLTFDVLRAGVSILPPLGTPLVSPVDGLANRDYTAVPGTHYLTGAHADSWTDLTVAEDRMASIKTQAELLVTEMNTAEWTGTERVEYP